MYKGSNICQQSLAVAMHVDEKREHIKDVCQKGINLTNITLASISSTVGEVVKAAGAKEKAACKENSCEECSGKEGPFSINSLACPI